MSSRREREYDMEDQSGHSSRSRGGAYGDTKNPRKSFLRKFVSMFSGFWMFVGGLAGLVFLLGWIFAVIMGGFAADWGDHHEAAWRAIPGAVSATKYQWTYKEYTLWQYSGIAAYNLTAGATLASGNGLVLFGSTEEAIPTELVTKKRAVMTAEGVEEVETVQPSWPVGGIRFVNNDAGIEMDGGNITGATAVYADNVYGDVRARLVGHTGRAIAAGRAVGFLANGSLAEGFSPIPSSEDPIENQDLTLRSASVPFDETFLSVVRFSEYEWAVLYANGTSSQAVFARRISVDPLTNARTYTGPGLVLATGTFFTNRQFKACSLEAADGTGAKHVLISYIDATYESIWGTMCDLSNINAVVCQTGAAAGGTLLVHSGLTPKISDMICTVRPAEETTPGARWATIAFIDSGTVPAPSAPLEAIIAAESLPNNTDTVQSGGWVFNVRFVVPASTPAVYPIAITPLRQIGAVDNLTDVSTSSDLSNCPNCIKLHVVNTKYYGVSWRTGVTYSEGKTEVEMLQLPGKTIALTKRWSGLWVTSYDNPDAEELYFFCSSGVLSGTWLNLYMIFTIGGSNVAIATAVRFDTATLAFGTTIRSHAIANLNPLYALNSDQALSIEGVCANQVVVSYSAISNGMLVGESVVVTYEPGLTTSTISAAKRFSNHAVYIASNSWRALSDSAFSCAAGLHPFVTVFVTDDRLADSNSTIFAASGLAGSYSMTYAHRDKPERIVGVTTAASEADGTVAYQTSGSLNMCSYIDTSSGAACPYEFPAPVYACSDGEATLYQYCTDSNVYNPAQLLGFTSPLGDVNVSPSPAA